MRRDEALTILASQAEDLRSRKVKTLSVFGSVARDEAGPDSDVDILVEFSAPVGLFEFIDLKDHLSELLGRRVDLATHRALRREMRDQILKEAIRAA